MKSILIIGMGKFGHHLCADLIKNGNDIMVMDKDEASLITSAARVPTRSWSACTVPRETA